MTEQVTKSIFDLEEYKPYQERWEDRQKELKRRKSYYTGDVYKNVREQLGFLAPRLYRGVKPLYLPLARAVDVDAGIIPGGWPLVEGAQEKQIEAMKTIFDWSNWGTEGVLFVHYGAQYGVSGLKVSDLRDDKKVLVQPVDPQRFMLEQTSAYDPTPGLSFFIEDRVAADGNTVEYAEVITPENINIYINGVTQEYDGQDAQSVNELGFVPYVEVRHIETGEALGECTYQKAIPMLDEVNQLASYLADIIAKNAEPQWAVFGAEASDLEKSGDNVWFVPMDGDVKAVLPVIDIAGVLAFVQEIAKNVKNSLPELSFEELREKSQIATATLELQLLELVLKIRRSRPNYDAGLAEALRMAGRAAGTMSLRDISILDDEALQIDPERPVLPLDPITEIELQMSQLALDREMAMGIGEGFDDGSEAV